MTEKRVFLFISAIIGSMEKVKNFFAKIKLRNVAFGTVLVVLGLLFVIFPEGSLDVVCYVAGAALAAWGVITLLAYFFDGIKRDGSNGLTAGTALVCGAVLLLVKPQMVTEILTAVLGIALIIDGAAKIQLSVELSRRGDKIRWLLAIFGALAVILGIILAFNPFSSRNALMIYAGVALIVAGVCDLVAECFPRGERGSAD